MPKAASPKQSGSARFGELRRSRDKRNVYDVAPVRIAIRPVGAAIGVHVCRAGDFCRRRIADAMRQGVIRQQAELFASGVAPTAVML